MDETRYKLITLESFWDDRGGLTALEEGKEIPFAVKRVFYVYGGLGFPHTAVWRGGHAHKECWQVFICMSGTSHVKIETDDGEDQYMLTAPTKAIIIPPNTMFSYSLTKDTICLVLCSHLYDPEDYIYPEEEDNK